MSETEHLTADLRPPERRGTPGPEEVLAGDPLDRDGLLAAADAVARRLQSCRALAKDGSVTWLGARFSKADQRYIMAPVDPHLYGGTAGIAVFLAAAERFLEGRGYGELGLQAIEPLRRKLAALVADPERARSSSIRIGGMSALGSYIYSFTKTGELLNETSLIQEAHALTTLLTAERIGQDEAFEVVTGSAGTILVMLALDRLAPAPNSNHLTPLDIAGTCARRLLDARRSPDRGPRAWPWPNAPGRSPLTGFSHGAAGICYALFRLYERTQDSILWDAAQEGLAFERSHYLPEKRNWRDLRSSIERCMVSWCHGAPGISLGRLGALGIADDADIRQEIRAGLETTLHLAPTWLDHLCCGNMGRAEVLLYASQKLQDPSLFRSSLVLASSVQHRAQENGDFGWQTPGWSNAFDPSLIRGAAGIGYTFLRLAAPEKLPCILLLE
jgi:type 2 lantibiotic biosynthesis protein LanM